MLDVFTLVGIVCALMLSFGVLLLGMAKFYEVDAVRRYSGLREQIMDASSDLAANLKDNETLCVRSVRTILMCLHQRITPDVLDVIANDGLWRDIGK